MFRGLTDLLSTLAQLLPPEVLVPLVVVLAIAAVPLWWRSVRTRQIKGRLRVAARARTEDERHGAIEAAFAMASDKPRLLVALTEQAIRNGQTPVWRRALQALEATGKAELDLAALRRKVQAPPKGPRDPFEAAVRVERLRASGLHVAAREVLDEALSRHPDDPDLLALDRGPESGDDPGSPAHVDEPRRHPDLADLRRTP